MAKTRVLWQVGVPSKSNESAMRRELLRNPVQIQVFDSNVDADSSAATRPICPGKQPWSSER